MITLPYNYTYNYEWISLKLHGFESKRLIGKDITEFKSYL